MIVALSIYDDFVLPHLINLSMGNRALRPYRERVLAISSSWFQTVCCGVRSTPRQTEPTCQNATYVAEQVTR